MKYGVKTIIRFPIRSLLFFLLIGAACLFLSLGMSIWFAAQNMLAEADDACTTAGEVVFQGGGYPDAGTYDASLAEISGSFDIAALGSLFGALMVEENYEHRAYVKNGPLESNKTAYTGFAILEIDVRAPFPNRDYFMAYIRKVHYSAGEAPSGAIYMLPYEDGAFNYQVGHTYLVSGNFVMIGGVPNSAMLPRSYSSVVTSAGGPSADYSPVLDITDYSESELQAFWESETGLFYGELSEMVRVAQNSVTLVASADIESVGPFHTGEYTLLDGRFFSARDYETGDVCIIPERMAESLGLTVGGALNLGVHLPVNGAGVYASYWPEIGFAHEGSYRIAGIYQSSDKNTPVYIPYAGQAWLAHSENDYTLGRVVVQNGMADAFYAEAKPLLPVGVTLRLYDQGYEHIARSLSGMKETAQVIIFVSAAVCLVILLFFGFLFVSRQAVSVSILTGLGTSVGHTLLFFLSGAGLVAALASIIGGGAAYFVSDSLTHQIWAASQLPSRRFSLSGNSLQMTVAEPDVMLWPFLLTAALVIILALLICACCLLLVLRTQSARFRARKAYRNLHKKEKKVIAPTRAVGASLASRLPGHALRYGMKTMLRGYRRALFTVLVFAVLFCAVGVMDGLRTGYESSLANAYREIPVTVQFTDVKGQIVDGVSINASSYEKLAGYDFTAESWKSRNEVYYYAGSVKENGEAANWMNVPPPGTFAYEAFKDQLNARFSPLVLSDAPAYTKNHFYSGAPKIEWAQGYDLEKYQNSFRWVTDADSLNMEGTPAFLVSESFLRTHGLSLGESIHIQSFLKLQDERVVDLTLTAPVAGIYYGGLLPQTVYVTSSFILPEYSLHAAGIRLNNTENLDEIRNRLSADFSEPFQYTGNRVWVYIEDSELYKTVTGLERYVGYLNYLQPVMLAVALGMGFLTANLTLRARRREIALLRSVGTDKVSVFFSLYWEQLLVCVPGILLGFLGIMAITGHWIPRISIGLSILTLCFLAGAAAAIIQTQRVALMQNLLERE